MALVVLSVRVVRGRGLSEITNQHLTASGPTVYSEQTEMGESHSMPQLSPVMQKFILHWGEMGQKWGINRSVAQIHALLYLSDQPLTAEDISDTLGLARSNVSTSLRELQGWRIVRVMHLMGDRRDHFESLTDVWEMFRIVLDERKKREIDPTRVMIEQCLAELDSDRQAGPHVRERLDGMLVFLNTMSTWYSHLHGLPTSGVIRFFKMGQKVKRMLSGSGG